MLLCKIPEVFIITLSAYFNNGKKMCKKNNNFFGSPNILTIFATN